MVNHATALNYHMYTSSLHCSGVQLCTQQWTVESGQIATVCRWEHIAVGKGFLLLLGSRHQIEEVPNLSSICAANYHVCQLETKYHLYRSKVCTFPSCTWLRFTWILAPSSPGSCTCSRLSANLANLANLAPGTNHWQSKSPDSCDHLTIDSKSVILLDIFLKLWGKV